MDTKRLLRATVGRTGEKRLDKAMGKRWVYGRGCPVVKIGVRYLDSHVFQVINVTYSKRNVT